MSIDLAFLFRGIFLGGDVQHMEVYAIKQGKFDCGMWRSERIEFGGRNF